MDSGEHGRWQFEMLVAVLVVVVAFLGMVLAPKLLSGRSIDGNTKSMESSNRRDRGLELYTLQQCAYTELTSTIYIEPEVEGQCKQFMTMINDPNRLCATIDEALRLMGELGLKSDGVDDATDVIYNDPFEMIQAGNPVICEYSEANEETLSNAAGRLIKMITKYLMGTVAYRHVVDRFMLNESLGVLQRLKDLENSSGQVVGANVLTDADAQSATLELELKELYTITALVTAMNLSERYELRRNAQDRITDSYITNMYLIGLPQILSTIYSKYRSESSDRSEVLSDVLKYLTLVKGDANAQRRARLFWNDQTRFYEEGLQVKLIGFEGVISQLAEVANHMFMFQLFGLNNMDMPVPYRASQPISEGRKILLKFGHLCQQNPEIIWRPVVDPDSFREYIVRLLSRDADDPRRIRIKWQHVYDENQAQYLSTCEYLPMEDNVDS